MRKGILAAAFVLGMQTWAAAQNSTEQVKQPLGPEAYKLLTSFYNYDRDIPLEARAVAIARGDRPAEPMVEALQSFEKIVFRSRDSWVVGYLGIPKTGSPPYPCVLELHGIGGSKTGWWEDDSFFRGGHMTRALLDAGIAIFTPDAQYSGERSYTNGFASPTEVVFKNEWWSRFRGMFVQSVIDCRRSVDYLETRSEIDASRLGVIGYSLGGLETFALTALDARIKVSVACVTPLRHESIGSDDVWAPRNFARALAGRPFLMQMGRTDPAYKPEQAKRIFDLIPGSTKQIVWYDSGHKLPVEYAPKATEWLLKELK